MQPGGRAVGLGPRRATAAALVARRRVPHPQCMRSSWGAALAVAAALALGAETATADEPARCAPAPSGVAAPAPSGVAAPACLGLDPSRRGRRNPPAEPHAGSAAPHGAVEPTAPPSLTGAPLQVCSLAPRTGFRRSGRCETGPDDVGVHVVCAELTEAFLRFTRAQGNDLSTPRPDLGFPGLVPGDRWCLCASRWAEADAAGVAPPVVLDATHAAATRHVARGRLEARAARPAPASTPAR